jgi:hypothetical protein
MIDLSKEDIRQSLQDKDDIRQSLQDREKYIKLIKSSNLEESVKRF